MTHEEIRSYLEEYAEGRLSGPLLDEVEAHLSECPSCRNWLRYIQAQRSALSSFPEEDAPDLSAWAAQQRWVREPAEKPSARRITRAGRFAGIAAALLLLVGLGAGIIALRPFAASTPAAAPRAMKESAEAADGAAADSYSRKADGPAEEEAAEMMIFSDDSEEEPMPEGDVPASAETNEKRAKNAAADEGADEAPGQQDETASGDAAPDPETPVSGGPAPAPRRTGLYITLAILAGGIVAVVAGCVRMKKENRER